MSTDQNISVRRAKLSAAKRALLEKRLRGEATGPSQREVIPRRPDREVIPLSFAQQRMWFLDQVEPGISTFNMSGAVRLSGQLNGAALKQSLSEIVKRHEVLRTTFTSKDGWPTQVINPAGTLALPLVDLQDLPESEREAEAQRLVTEEANRPFDLTRGPFLRATLLQLGPQEHVLSVSMHHMVSDGWSIGVCIRELVTLYKAFSDGHPSPLPECPIQYADFADWQRQRLRGELLENQLAYWKERLGGRLPVLNLPTNRPRPPVHTFSGATQRLALPKALSESLKTLSHQGGVTLFMMLLAAFKTLLYRYTGQEDIIVGSPIANRTRVETEGLIGYLANTLVLRTDLSGNPRFHELLDRVRETALGAYAHQELPFEVLVKALQPKLDLNYTPLFQVLFLFQNAPMPDLELPGLVLNDFEVDRQATAFDLTLSLGESRQQIRGFLDYRTDLFDRATIDRMLGHFQTLLEGIVANPEQRLSDLPLLTEAERHQVLVEWNDNQPLVITGHSPVISRQTCIHELFEAQVERTPEAVAVVYDEQQLTYRELNARANQLARHLQALGVGPEVRVGVYLARSLERLVGLLGILKAGGAYVPLDPTYPQERLAFMLADAQVRVLLIQERLGDLSAREDAQASRVDTLDLSGSHASSPHVVRLDSEWEIIARQSAENPVSRTDPDNVAYVIYTSNSTGIPKGVLIPQRAMINHVVAMAGRCGIGADDRMLQLPSTNFDTAIENPFLSWLNGAAVVLRPDGLVTPGVDWRRLIERERVTVLNLPMTTWHEWGVELSRSGEPLPACLRLVIVGRARASAQRFSIWQKLGGIRLRWLNIYGPAEATAIATIHEQAPCVDEEDVPSELPIGRPIDHVQIYLLDAHRQLVPVGVPGELHIGGAGLARGYLNQPELTAETFIPHPFGDEPGARLYKTGDLARYRSDGTIELFGDLNHQVNPETTNQSTPLSLTNQGDVELLPPRVDQLSDAEVDSLLNEMLAQQEIHE